MNRCNGHFAPSPAVNGTPDWLVQLRGLFTEIYGHQTADQELEVTIRNAEGWTVNLSLPTDRRAPVTTNSDLCQLLTIQQVAKRISLQVKGVYRLLKRDPTFPRPIRFSQRSVRWQMKDVDAWIEAQLDGL